jgi:hypothetical protein
VSEKQCSNTVFHSRRAARAVVEEQRESARSADRYRPMAQSGAEGPTMDA